MKPKPLEVKRVGIAPMVSSATRDEIKARATDGKSQGEVIEAAKINHDAVTRINVGERMHEAAAAYANWMQSEWRAVLEGNQDAWNRIAAERVLPPRFARVDNLDKL